VQLRPLQPAPGLASPMPGVRRDPPEPLTPRAAPLTPAPVSGPGSARPARGPRRPRIRAPAAATRACDAAARGNPAGFLLHLLPAEGNARDR
jgi:hypothetical protein